MKKKYTSPSTMTYRVQTLGLMIEFSNNSQGNGSVTPSNKGAQGAAMGRGGNGWDDDE